MITLTYSCLEPTGDEGSAIGKNTGDEDTEGDSTEDDSESGIVAVTFADVSDAITQGCVEGCHVTGGVVTPVLETEADWKAESADGVSNGESSLATLQPEAATPMPPVGASQTILPEDKANLIKWIEDGMP